MTKTSASTVSGRSIGSRLSRTRTAPSSAGRAVRDPIGIVLAGDDERALALDRPDQRAHLALEFELVEHEPRAARGIGEERAAVHDIEPLDRDRFGIDRRSAARGQSKPAARVERDREFRALEPHVGRAPLAAHQRTEREFDAERCAPAAFRSSPGRAISIVASVSDGVGSSRASIGPAMRTCRPVRRLAWASNCGAIPVPVDKMRPDQRRHQRQDQRNRDAEQRRLHAVSTAEPLDRPASGKHGRSPDRVGTCQVNTIPVPRLRQPSVQPAPICRGLSTRRSGRQPHLALIDGKSMSARQGLRRLSVIASRRSCPDS